MDTAVISSITLPFWVLQQLPDLQSTACLKMFLTGLSRKKEDLLMEALLDAAAVEAVAEAAVVVVAEVVEDAVVAVAVNSFFQ